MQSVPGWPNMQNTKGEDRKEGRGREGSVGEEIRDRCRRRVVCTPQTTPSKYHTHT